MLKHLIAQLIVNIDKGHHSENGTLKREQMQSHLVCTLSMHWMHCPEVCNFPAILDQMLQSMFLSRIFKSNYKMICQKIEGKRSLDYPYFEVFSYFLNMECMSV